jgi:uncharacterized repeat protein (TIGR01451 family)
MRQVLDMLKRGAARVSFRVAMLLFAVPTGGVATWQGYSYWKTPPKGPTKQIATGVVKTGTEPTAIQPAVASLTDDQLPDAAPPTGRLMAYETPSPATLAPPPVNPYLPTSNDPPGGYEASAQPASRYGAADFAYGQPETAPPTAVPADPASSSPATEGIPENAFRTGPAATAATAPPAVPPFTQSPNAAVNDSPVAPAGDTPQAAPSPSPPAVLTPSIDAASALAGALTEPASPPALAPPVSIPTNALPSFGSGSAAPMQRNTERLAAPTPGERQLEGPQQPAITLEKVAPTEIQVGKPARFDLYLRNTGSAAASGVTVSDHVPAGTQLIDARPAPQQSPDGALVWAIGAMQPGEEVQITLQVMPQTEGEIGSVAQVSFTAAATSRSICTRPQLAIEHTAPPKVLIGDAFTVGITVSNPGTGPATGVMIEEDVPAGVVHAAGSQLEYDIGTLRPGETKHLELALRAEKPGLVQNTIRVRGEGSLAAEHTVQVEVIAPQLQVAVEGPKLRFLERQATYTVQVANPGTAAAREVELVAHLPRGMKFVSTDSLGQYDVPRHAVIWSLAELPQATKGAVKLTLLPVEAGDQPLRVEGRGALGLSAVGEQIVRVEQAAELVHTVKDLDEVIEVGSETTYEIRVHNQGTKAATSVRVTAIMPAGMAAIHGEGPTRAAGDATQIAFEPLARLNPQEEVIYKVQAQGRQPGDQIVRVQIASDEWPAPVTREESTRVYEDR